MNILQEVKTEVKQIKKNNIKGFAKALGISVRMLEYLNDGTKPLTPAMAMQLQEKLLFYTARRVKNLNKCLAKLKTEINIAQATPQIMELATRIHVERNTRNRSLITDMILYKNNKFVELHHLRFVPRNRIYQIVKSVI